MKKHIFGVIAIAITIVSLAFTVATPRVACDGASGKKWFKYIGPAYPGTATLADLRNPNNYVEATSNQLLACDDVNFLCAICAFEDGTTDKPFIRVTDDIYLDLADYFAAPSSSFSSITEKTLATE